MKEFMASVWKDRVCDECGKVFPTSVEKRDWGYKHFSQYKKKKIRKVFCGWECYNRYLTRLEQNDKNYVNWRDLVAKDF